MFFKILFVIFIGRIVLAYSDANFSIDQSTPIVMVNHDYYDLTIHQVKNDLKNSQYSQWVNNMSDDSKVVLNKLSNKSLGAEMINLKEYGFSFPFYGHELEKIYVTTAGFLSLSFRIHSFIYKTQYIAPLRLKLDPSLSKESVISYKLTGKNLTVEWSRMRLSNSSQKEITFQVKYRVSSFLLILFSNRSDNKKGFIF